MQMSHQHLTRIALTVLCGVPGILVSVSTVEPCRAENTRLPKVVSVRPSKQKEGSIYERSQTTRTLDEALRRSAKGCSVLANKYFREHPVESFGPVLKRYLGDDPLGAVTIDSAIALGPGVVTPLVTEILNGARHETVNIEVAGAYLADSVRYSAAGHREDGKVVNVNVPSIKTKNTERLCSRCKRLLGEMERREGLRNETPVYVLVHRDAVAHLALNPDGKSFLTGCLDTLFFWELESGRRLHDSVPDKSHITHAIYDASRKDSVVAATAYPRAAIFKVNRVDVTRNDSTFVYEYPFSVEFTYARNGKRSVQLGDANNLLVFDIEADRPVGDVWNTTASVKYFAISPDGKTVATNRGGSSPAMPTDNSTILWDADSNEKVAYLDNKSIASGVAFGNKPRLLAVGGDALYLWDTDKTTTPIGRFTPFRGGVVAIALSGNGEVVAGGNAEGEVAVYDVERGRKLFHATAHSGPINGLLLTQDGTTLVSCSEDGTAKVWRISGEK